MLHPGNSTSASPRAFLQVYLPEAWLVFSFAVAMKLTGSNHLCPSQGGGRPRECLTAPAFLPSSPLWQGHVSGLWQGTTIPTSAVHLPGPRLQGLVSHPVLFSEPCWAGGPVHTRPLLLSQGICVALAGAQHMCPGPEPRWLLRASGQRLSQGQSLRTVFQTRGDFSNVPERCGRGRGML